MKAKKFLSLLVAMAMLFSCVGITAMAEGSNVAKVGDTEYATIDEAIAAWTNGKTLTLLSDVTLSDVITIKSTEHHILDLGTYTMTAASGKNAIEITCEGLSNATYALTVNADATNPGGITATGKACIYYYKTGSTKDRPIIVINGGVYNGSYSINSVSNGNTNCPQFRLNGGTFNGNVNLTKNMLWVSGGTFNGWVNCTGDSSAYRQISGGTFKQWQFMTADADSKFWVGTSKANYNVGVYVDDNGYLVVGGPVVTEPDETFEASSANYGGWSSYLKYSSAVNNGLYYTSVEEAFADNNKASGSVTVYVDELDMTGINYKGTIVVPKGEKITIIVEEDTKPTWTVSEGSNVTYTDDKGNALEKNDEDGSFVKPDTGETNADVIVDGIDVEITPVDGVSNSYEITLAEGETWTDGESVTMTFLATGEMAYVVHEHNGTNYIYVGDVVDSTITINNTVGFSTFTVYEGDLQTAINAAKTDDTVIISAGEYGAINISNKSITIQGTVGDDGELLTTIKGGNPAITGHSFNGTIKNIKIVDAWKVMYAEPAGNVTVDNVYVTGATYGFHLVAYSPDLTWTIQNSYMDLAWANSFGVDGNGDADIIIRGNEFAATNPYYEGGDVYPVNSYLPSVTVEENIFGENTRISIENVTDTSKINISKNYHADGVENAFDSGSVTVPIKSYYTDVDENGNLSGLVEIVDAVAKVNGVEYPTLAEAVEKAKSGDEIVLLADVTEDVTVPAGIIFNGNGKQVGIITAAGEITFKGHTKATNFGTQYTNTTINIGKGATLELTGTGRMVIGHGCTFNIEGNITDAKTANTAELTPSLIIPGASFTGAGVTFNVKDAYIKTTASYCSSSSSASGTFDFNIENSIWEQFGKLAFESQSTAATVNFDLKDSVLTTTSHLVFGVSRGEIVIDNSNVNVGTSRQIENQSTMTIKNGSVVNGAVATSSNAKNPGTIIVDNATYAVTGQFSGSDLGTGTLIIKKGATVSVGSIVDKANITIDATGMTVDDVINFTGNLSKFEGSVNVINNNALDAKIVDGKIVLVTKPVAYIGEQGYETIDAAIGEANANDVITITEGTHNLAAQLVIDKAVVIQGAGVDSTILNYTVDDGSVAVSITGSGVTVKNLTVTHVNTAAYNSTCIALGGSDNTLDTVKFTGGRYALSMRGKNLTVQNCTFGTREKEHILIYTVTGTTNIVNNNFETSNKQYILVSTDSSAAAGTTSGTMNISGNSADSLGQHFFNYEDSSKASDLTLKITDNRLTNITGKAVVIYGSTGAFSEITVTENVMTRKEGTDTSLICVESTSTGTTVNANGNYFGSDPDLSKLVVNKSSDANTSITVENYYDSYDAETDTLFGLIPVSTPVAKIGETTYATLEEAFKAATDGCTIDILSDVTIDYYWDCRDNVTNGSHSRFQESVTINGNNHKLTFTNTVYDAGNHYAAFRFEADATVKNLTIDMKDAISGFNGRFRAISAKGNLTVDNCTFIGNGSANNTRAIIFGESAAEGALTETDIVVTNSEFIGWRNGVIDNESGNSAKEVKTVKIEGNTFTNANVNVSASDSVAFNNNVMDNSWVIITTYAATPELDVVAKGNTLEKNGTTSTTINKINSFATKDVQEGFWFPVETVAEVNGVGYETLAAAIDAANAGDTVTLVADITLSEVLTVAADKELTLDLAGFAVDYDSDVAGEAMITNKGNLTIADSSEEKTGKITFTYVGEPDSNYGKGNYTISNGGTLTVEGGTITNDTAKMSHACYAIDNNSINGAATLTVNGGTIVNNNNYAVRQIAGNNKNTVTVNDGEIIGTRALWMQLAGSDTTVAPEVALNVNGGKLTATGESADYKLAVYSYSYGNNMENVSVTVTDGVLDGDIALTGGKNKTAIETVTVTGGTINDLYSYGEDDAAAEAITITGGIFKSNNAEIYALDDGFEFVANDDGTFGVIEKAAFFEFYGASPILSNSLAIDFYVARSNFDGDGYYAVIEHDTAKGVANKTIPMDSWTPNGSYYLIRYNDITAKQITETMYITIYDKDGNQVSVRREDGVKAYAERQLAKETTSAKLKTTLVDMLNYGAAAQKQFGYRTDMLANADLTEEQKAYASNMPEIIDESEFYADKCGGTSLVLKDNIKLDVYFKGITKGMYATATYTKYNESEPRTYEFKYGDFVANGSYNVLTLGTLVIADAKQLVTITVYNEDGSVYTTYKDSMNSYLARQLENGDAESDIYTMTAKFTSSAYNLFRTN